VWEEGQPTEKVEDAHAGEEEEEGLWEIVQFECRLFFSYFRIPSFLSILIQGMFGLIPWAAMTFMTLWFQYMGISNFKAGLLITFMTFACGVGGIVGGFVGDRLAEWSPFHGRPLAAQISVASGIGVFLLILFAVPHSPSSYPFFVLLLIAFGLTASWAGVGCNSPLLIELVSLRSRARIFALLNSLNGAVAACMGGPVVGVAAETFGYRSPDTGVRVAEMEAGERESNFIALTEALALATVLPWLVCLAAFTALHFTYERDVMYSKMR